MKEKKKTKFRDVLFKTVIILVFLAGVALLLYPSLGNVISCTQQQQVIAEYEKQVELMHKKSLKQQKELAIDYNKSLKRITLQDPFSDKEKPTESPKDKQMLDENYEAISVGGDNMLGFIKIPAINISIPIYHDATEIQLEKGIGHLRGTSLPVGGKGTHCVLSGHTGVPGNMLFTDLDKLVLGNKFYLHVLDDVLAYKVDQIEIVKPDDTSKIAIDPEKDYCTLITCTPYGINTHRLLVRGERTEYIPGEDEDNVQVVEVTDDDGRVIERKIAPLDYIEIFGIRIPHWVIYLLLPATIMILILLIVIISRRKMKQIKQTRNNP